MMETLTLDEVGRLVLSEAALQLLGVRPGETLRANVTARGIEILEPTGAGPAVPEFGGTQLENGILVLASTGIEADIASATRAGRDELAGRAVPR